MECRDPIDFPATYIAQDSTLFPLDYVLPVQASLSLQPHLAQPAQQTLAYTPLPPRPWRSITINPIMLNMFPEQEPRPTAPLQWNTLQPASAIQYVDDTVLLFPRPPPAPTLLCVLVYDMPSKCIHILLFVRVAAEAYMAMGDTP